MIKDEDTAYEQERQRKLDEREECWKYFALLDTEDVVLIGEYSDIDGAFHNAPENTLWVFGEYGLRQLHQNILKALNEAAMGSGASRA